jgi:hypothetical protein
MNLNWRNLHKMIQTTTFQFQTQKSGFLKLTPNFQFDQPKLSQIIGRYKYCGSCEFHAPFELTNS